MYMKFIFEDKSLYFLFQLEAEDASRRLTSTTTTVIKTQAQTEGHPTKHN